MESGYSEEKFKAHIRTVVEQSEGDTLEERPLTLDELKELAISMGMSEEEWNALQQKAHIHLRSAEKHLKARNFDEAISEAEKATSINPYLANGNSVLAKSYQMLWLEDDNTIARDKAEYYARKELLVDPNDATAINVLSTVNKKRKLTGNEAKSKKLFYIIGGVIALLLVIGYFSFSSGESNEIQTKLIVAEEDVFAKYDLVQTAINRRNKMLPDMFGAAGNNHSDLSSINAEIEQLQNQLSSAEGDKKFQLENKIDEKISEAKQLVRAYGDPSTVETLMIEIEGAENRISFEKKAYNDAVKAYNILVKQHSDDFPEYETQSYYNAN